MRLGAWMAEIRPYPPKGARYPVYLMTEDMRVVVEQPAHQSFPHCIAPAFRDGNTILFFMMESVQVVGANWGYKLELDVWS